MIRFQTLYYHFTRLKNTRSLNATVLQKSAGTVRAETRDHKIPIGRFESIRKIYLRDGKVLKTEGIFTGRAIEVGVHIVGIRTGTVLSAQPIFCTSTLIIDLMNHTVLLKCFQCSVECGTVCV
jgi:hypothetical protein